MYQVVIKRFEDENKKTVYHILSRKEITLERMATINADHDKEKHYYQYAYLSESELRTLLGWRLGEFHEQYDFMIFAVHNVRRNRMDGSPD